MCYRRYWPKISAFAWLSFYDGRVHINLQRRGAMRLTSSMPAI